MKYRVHVCLAFDDPKIATAFMEIIKKDYLASACSLNEDKQMKEISHCFIEECYHDSQPVLPCKIIEKWEIQLGVPTNTIALKALQFDGKVG